MKSQKNTKKILRTFSLRIELIKILNNVMKAIQKEMTGKKLYYRNFEKDRIKKFILETF